MVIDDMHWDRFIAMHVIKQYNFAEDVILIEFAAEALVSLRSNMNTPDKLPKVIFLDIQMPEMDGFDFLEQFNTLPETITTNCAIVMLTSSVDHKDIERASQQKYVRHYITKPLDKEKLDTVNRILSGKNMSDI
jgi:CheY-like chemotaxis protein